MLSLSQIESDLTTALKSRNQLETDTLRALKTRIQNEQIAKMKELEESDILAIVQSEIKRRKEAAESFTSGGRTDLAEKEHLESQILYRYLPPQASPEEISAAADSIISSQQLTAADFGKAMGQLKAKFGTSAEGGVLAKILKEKLK